MNTPPLDDILQRLNALSAGLSERSAAEATQQQAFDALYQELQDYKEDHIFRSEKPLLLDLLLFYDSMSWYHQSLQERTMSHEAMVDGFQFLLDELLELLYRRDVVPMEPRQRFDRAAHRVVKVLETDEGKRDQGVAQVLKRGFMRGERVLRPEEVVVYRHTPSGEPATAPHADSGASGPTAPGGATGAIASSSPAEGS